jgi:hypothetical protein
MNGRSLSMQHRVTVWADWDEVAFRVDLPFTRAVAERIKMMYMDKATADQAVARFEVHVANGASERKSAALRVVVNAGGAVGSRSLVAVACNLDDAPFRLAIGSNDFHCLCEVQDAVDCL